MKKNNYIALAAAGIICIIAYYVSPIVIKYIGTNIVGCNGRGIEKFDGMTPLTGCVPAVRYYSFAIWYQLIGTLIVVLLTFLIVNSLVKKRK
jgi:hypothetical protein